MKNGRESDLYPPVAALLSKLGYQVSGEVKGCDIAAEKEGSLLVVELKKQFTLSLLYQAVERQTRAEEVYVAIPRPKKGLRTRQWKNQLALLKRLGIGLLTVALDSPLATVDCHLEAAHQETVKNKKKKHSLFQELKQRNIGYHNGGVNHTKILTAYREKSIAIACQMQSRGIVSAKELKESGLERTGPMLQRNVYGWFQKVSYGNYTLSSAGEEMLQDGEFSEAITFYREFANE